MCDFHFNDHHTQDADAPVLRVSASSPPHALAGSIAKTLRGQPTLHLHAMGLAAVYRALKATIIARTFLADDTLDLILQPTFIDVEDLPGVDRTAVRITLRSYLSKATTHST